MDYEVAVIGAGPGGLVSSLYLRRFLRRIVLISQGPSRASWIPRTHNLLGYRGGIAGTELLRRLNSQLDDCKVDRLIGEAYIESAGKIFKIKVGDDRIRAKKVIIATGMTDVQPPLKNLATLRRAGLLRYCPVCDAYEYRNKKLLVLAQDSHGIRAARFLSHYSKDIRVLWPSAEKLPARSEKSGAIAGVPFSRGLLESIEIDGGKALVTWSDSMRIRKAKYDAVYVALGSAIQDSAFRHLKGIKRNEDGFILVDAHQETGIEGLFAVGDCVEGLAQIAVASGQAAIAATAIHNYFLRM